VRARKGAEGLRKYFREYHVDLVEVTGDFFAYDTFFGHCSYGRTRV
jgi:hypothetical protein